MKSLEVHESFLDESLFEECYNFSNEVFNINQPSKLINHRKYITNIFCWEKEIVLDSSPILVYKMNLDHNYENDLKNRIINATHIKTNKKVISVLFYCYCSGSHIPWHNDTNYLGGITIYLNKDWDKNNGGLFLFENSDNITAIVPKKNTAVVQRGGVEHAVSVSSKCSPYRLTIQMFF